MSIFKLAALTELIHVIPESCGRFRTRLPFGVATSSRWVSCWRAPA